MTEVLEDPDFLDSLICKRKAQTIGSDGRAVNTDSVTPFQGVVTSDRQREMIRMEAGEHNTGSIIVISKFILSSGKPGYDADVVTWNGADYTVVQIDDYSRYGAGFTQAHCDLIPLAGA
ncbi:hypothetical protein [Solilutibacter silvestris]|uniref:hypothetical protein n=1 Tax=Solilutibacter silvestris TaxID=1645665 RepID=UPI003D326361